MILVHVRITVVVLFVFSKNEEEAIPPGGKKYLGTTKGRTRMILVHVRITVVVFFVFSKNEVEAIPPGGKKYLGTTKRSTRMILVHVQKMYKTCTEHVQYIKNINRGSRL